MNKSNLWNLLVLSNYLMTTEQMMALFTTLGEESDALKGGTASLWCFPMYQAAAVLLILGLRHPHLLERPQGRQDGPACSQSIVYLSVHTLCIHRYIF